MPLIENGNNYKNDIFTDFELKMFCSITFFSTKKNIFIARKTQNITTC